MKLADIEFWSKLLHQSSPQFQDLKLPDLVGACLSGSDDISLDLGDQITFAHAGADDEPDGTEKLALQISEPAGEPSAFLVHEVDCENLAVGSWGAFLTRRASSRNILVYDDAHLEPNKAGCRDAV